MSQCVVARQKCKPKPPGVLCRSAITECDLPEFCSGYSEYCSKDVTKADGEPCREVSNSFHLSREDRYLVSAFTEYFNEYLFKH